MLKDMERQRAEETKEPTTIESKSVL
jgi:hypothetical protein